MIFAVFSSFLLRLNWEGSNFKIRYLRDEEELSFQKNLAIYPSQRSRDSKGTFAEIMSGEKSSFIAYSSFR